MKSTQLLLLSVYLLLAILVTLCSLSRATQDTPGIKGFFNRKYRVNSTQTLTNALTGVGLFNVGLSYALQRLGVRMASQIRTRAALNGTRLSEILNSLPESPEWKILLKSKLAFMLQLVGLLMSVSSAGGGILYKQGLGLTTLTTEAPAEYPFRYITGCDHPPMGCFANKFAQYGVAMTAVQSGNEFTPGVERTEDGGYRVAYVGAPIIPAGSRVTRFSAPSIALVTHYRYVEAGEIGNTTRQAEFGYGNGPRGSGWFKFTFQPSPTLDWSLDVQTSEKKTYQRIGAQTRYCIVHCTWNNSENDTMNLHDYTYDAETDCPDIQTP